MGRIQQFAQGLVLAGVTVLLASCGSANEDPERLLSLSISGLSGQDSFTFVGQSTVESGGMVIQSSPLYEGKLINHNQLYVQSVETDNSPTSDQGMITLGPQPVLYAKDKNNRWIASVDGKKTNRLPAQWNPLNKLEQLYTMKKEVHSGQGIFTNGVTVLTIRPDAEENKRRMTQELTEQFQQYGIESRFRNANQASLSLKRRRQLEAEIKAAYTTEEIRLKKMLHTLQVESIYLLEIDRQTHLPGKLRIRDELTYIQDGKSRSETNNSSYEFKDYDKGFQGL
ncbi:hypothetical protein SY83_15495 [Paenibacillus swuensis]|uniref:Lipoprotein n=2 Tax=Paenibacillus swuensis TaxID=1178515 RepID=A0A172TK80_9BACL|nr:hypothetical protein SY83_15495 [Paenibacillus swuensis]